MVKTNFLMFIRGLPGAGKSTISNKISAITDSIVVDPDLISDKNNKATHEERFRKYKLCLSKAKKALITGHSVIWTQPWRKIQNILITINNLNSKDIRFLLVNMKIPTDESWNRSKTKFDNNREKFNNFVTKFTDFHKDFKVDSININGQKDIDENVKKIIKFLGYNVGDE